MFAVIEIESTNEWDIAAIASNQTNIVTSVNDRKLNIDWISVIRLSGKTKELGKIRDKFVMILRVVCWIWLYILQ